MEQSFRILMLVLVFFAAVNSYTYKRHLSKQNILGKLNDDYTPHTHKELDEELEAEEQSEDKGHYKGEIMEGDIKVNKRFKDIIDKGKFRKDVIVENYRWKSTTIPFVYDASATTLIRNVVQSAMDDFKQFTCIQFTERTTEADYLSFQAENTGCWSYVGVIGGKQEINVGAGCEYKGTVIHEIMHALGFYHEHTRLDRDNYVSIIFSNIPDDKKVNFQKYATGAADFHGEPYDFDSVMHYRAKAFSTNGDDTIVPKNSSIDVSRLGQRDGFSQTDRNQINKAYKCSDFLPSTTSTTSTTTSTTTPSTSTTSTTTSTTSTTTSAPTTKQPTTQGTTNPQNTAVTSTSNPTNAPGATTDTTTQSTSTATPSTTKSTTKTSSTQSTSSAVPPATNQPTNTVVPSAIATTTPVTMPQVPSITTSSGTTLPPTTKGRTTPVPPAAKVAPTPSPGRADGSTGDAIFPSLYQINTNFPQGSTHYNNFPSWPNSFSINQCNCQVSVQPSCRCNCIKVKKNNVESSYLCYRKSKRSPRFKFSTIGAIPGMKCTHVAPKTRTTHAQKRYLCHAKEAPYNFTWHNNLEDIKSDRDSGCMKFSWFNDDDSYLCNRSSKVDE